MATAFEHAEKAILFSTLSILQLIKDAQQQHGLRHQDYMRYRQYCTRRIRRIRRALKFTNAVKAGRNYKYVKKIVKKGVITDINYLLIPLFETERSWAYAMELKQAVINAADESGLKEEASTRKKFHMARKLRRAAITARHLEQLCKKVPKTDSATKLEATAYCEWILGCKHFEAKHYEKAIRCFAMASDIYESLSKAVSDPILVKAYQQRCQEMQPQLRYCQFETGQKTATIEELLQMRMKIVGDQSDNAVKAELDRLIASEHEKESKQAQEIVSFAGAKLNIADVSKLRELYLHINTFDKEINNMNSEDKLSAYEKLLANCRDAVQAIREQYKLEPIKTRANDDEMEVDKSYSTPQLLYSYACLLRMNKANERYELMLNLALNPNAAKKSKSVDIVRLYDNMLQNLVEIEQVPGVDLDLTLIQQLKTRQAYLNAFRSYYVAVTYMSQKKWLEALAIYEKAEERCDDAQKQAMDETEKKNLVDLMEKITMGKYSCTADRLYTEKESQKSEFKSKKKVQQTHNRQEGPLLENLDQYRGDTLSGQDILQGKIPLVRMPPNIEPMPMKPLYFDLALNHVKFPDLSDKIDQNAGQSQKKKGNSPSSNPDEKADNQEGISGMLKGWFWGSQK